MKPHHGNGRRTSAMQWSALSVLGRVLVALILGQVHLAKEANAEALRQQAVVYVGTAQELQDQIMNNAPLIQITDHLELSELHAGTKLAGTLVFPQPMDVDMAIWGDCGTPLNDIAREASGLMTSSSACGIAMAANNDGGERPSIMATDLRTRLWLSNLVIYSAQAPSDYRPGAVFGSGEVWLNNIAVANTFGGGIYGSDVNMYIVDSSFAGNNAGSQNGGAVSIASMRSSESPVLLVSSSAFQDNSAWNGGAISVQVPAGIARGTVVIAASSFLENSKLDGTACGQDVAVFYDKQTDSYPSIFTDSSSAEYCIDEVVANPVNALNGAAVTAEAAMWLQSLVQAGVYGANAEDPVGLSAAVSGLPNTSVPQAPNSGTDENARAAFDEWGLMAGCMVGGVLFICIVACLAMKLGRLSTPSRDSASDVKQTLSDLELVQSRGNAKQSDCLACDSAMTATKGGKVPERRSSVSSECLWLPGSVVVVAADDAPVTDMHVRCVAKAARGDPDPIHVILSMDGSVPDTCMSPVCEDACRPSSIFAHDSSTGLSPIAEHSPVQDVSLMREESLSSIAAHSPVQEVSLMREESLSSMTNTASTASQPNGGDLDDFWVAPPMLARTAASHADVRAMWTR